ncbi:MAG: hypothetical protein V2B14_04855 [bacterium]
MYYHNYCLDEIESTGDNVRRKNKLKAKNYMSLAISFIDDYTLSKIWDILLNLPPDEMKNFKEYMKERKYLKKRINNDSEQKIINKIIGIATTSLPKDVYLRKIHEEYNKNLNKIDELKIEASKTMSCIKQTKIIAEIKEYNDRNIQLMENINKYREEKEKNKNKEE